MDPGLEEIVLTQDQDQELEGLIKLRDPEQLPEKVRGVSRFGQILTCRLKVRDIQEVWASELVLSLKAPRFVGIDPEPEGAALLLGQDQEQFAFYQRRPDVKPKGKGVVVGIVDWGFDFTHSNFRKPDGRTRFLSIWDQAAPADSSTAKYGYGRIYSADEIDEALQSPLPFDHLGYHPAQGDPLGSGAHGTHVADIAVGNGAFGQTGVAPEADIVAVHLSAGSTRGLASLGNLTRLLEAIDHIAEVAGDRPVVINLSIGKHGGHHKGVSPLEQGMDAFLREKPGRCIVQSTGNYYRARAHASGRVRSGRSHVLNWEVDHYDRTPNELEVWYSGKDTLGLVLKAPVEGISFRADLDQIQDIIIDGELVGRIYHRSFEPNTKDHHIDIFLYKNAPTGQWEVELLGKDIVDGRFHSWIERDSSCMDCQSRFADADADPNYTTGTICNGFYTMAVGAIDPSTEQYRLAPFSSSGPTRDGRPKPNLLAPGVRILAARSTPASQQVSDGALTYKSGTSMAAPHITGAVALLFEMAKEPLPIETTRQLVLSSTQKMTILDEEMTSRYGEGTLDINKMLENYQAHLNSYKMKNLNHIPENEEIRNENLPEEELSVETPEVLETELEEIAFDDQDARYEEEREEEWANIEMQLMLSIPEEEDSQMSNEQEFMIEEAEEEEFIDADFLYSQMEAEEHPDSFLEDIPAPELSFSDAAEIFDRVLFQGRNSMAYESLGQLANLPGERLTAIHEGDLILNRALGEGKLAFLHTARSEALRSNAQERHLAGHYIQVGQDHLDDQWLRVADLSGRTAPNIMVFRKPTEALEFFPDQVSDWSAFANLAAMKAIEEWETWNFGKKREDDSAMLPHLQKYWQSSRRGRDANRAMQLAKSAARNKSPWSAAFISYVMKTAGAGDQFAYSDGHWTYATRAKRNRQANRVGNPFWLYRLNEVKPEIGDLICNYRSSKKLTYENIQDAKPYPSKERAMHCDIVVQVMADKVWVIGGNVSIKGVSDRGLTVGRKIRKLDQRGYLQPSNRVFAIIKIRKNANSTPSSTSGTPDKGSDNPLGIDVQKAIRLNRRYSKTYGWEDFISQIIRLLNLQGQRITPRQFALTVAKYQKKKGFPRRDVIGILGPKTWAAMRKDLAAAALNNQQKPPPDKPRPSTLPFQLSSAKKPEGFSYDSSKRRGLVRYGGGRLEDKLIDLRNRNKIRISNEEIDIFQRIANVETRGEVQALNTWDSAVVSIGFLQFTLQYGKLQEWIKKAPADFLKYGIELDDLYYSWGGNKQKAIKGATNKNALRWNGWAQRFFFAGLDENIISAEVELAKTYLKRHLAGLKRRLKSKKLPDSYYDTFVLAYYPFSAYVRGMFQAAFNNYPVAAVDGVIRALNEVGVLQSVDIRTFEAALKKGLLNAYAARNNNGNNIVTKTSKGASLSLD